MNEEDKIDEAIRNSVSEILTNKKKVFLVSDNMPQEAIDYIKAKGFEVIK